MLGTKHLCSLLHSYVGALSFSVTGFGDGTSEEVNWVKWGHKGGTLIDKVIELAVLPVVMYRCESWTINKAECWRIYAFKLILKTLESPLDCKEIQPVNPTGNQPWIFIGRTDAEVPIFCQTDAKSQLVGKDCDVGKEWGQEEKGKLRMRWLDGISFEQTPGVS